MNEIFIKNDPYSHFEDEYLLNSFIPQILDEIY